MELELTNVTAFVVSATEDELAWLIAYLTVEHETYQGGRKKTASILDVTVEDTQSFCAFNPWNKSFPAGLAVMLPKVAKTVGIVVTVVDVRNRVAAPDLSPENVHWLRDYQAAAVRALIFRGGRGLIKAATGAGKTEIFIALTRVVDCEWLFLVHRIDVATQTIERYLARTGERAGTFEKGVWRKGTCNVTITSFQSVASALRQQRRGKASGRKGARDVTHLLREVEAIFVDEVQSLSGALNYDICQSFEGAYYRIGASGTPLDRKDKDTLQTIGALGPILTEITTPELVERGVLAHSIIRMIPCYQWMQCDATWPEVYDACVVNSDLRNGLIVTMIEVARKPCLAFVINIAHGQTLLRHVEASGLRVQFVHGEEGDTSARRAVLDRLVAGELDVVICTVIFQEGVDVPQLASGVIATGQASVVATLQRLGRIIRRAPGKEVFEIWDVQDQGQFWIEKQALARRDAYEREGHVVLDNWS